VNADGTNTVTRATEDADHNPEGLIVYSDVTEHSRRERELAAAKARLETIAAPIDDDVRNAAETSPAAISRLPRKPAIGSTSRQSTTHRR